MATRRIRLLAGLALMVTSGTDCAHRTRRAADPTTEQVERLAASAFGVLHTNGLSHAFAVPACGPTDGPAVTLYLSDARTDVIPPTSRHVRLTISRERASMSHQTLKWVDSRGPGEAALCVDGSCAAMTAGQIDFGQVDARRIDGTIDLLFTNGIRIRKQFRGAWRHVPVICG